MSLGAQPQHSVKPDLLFDRSSLSIERLPGLAVVFEQFVESLSGRLAALCSSRGSLSLEKIESSTLFSLMAERQNLMTAFLYCSEFDARAFVVFDPEFVGAFAHSVFGGSLHEGKDRTPAASFVRPCTRIELSLLERLSQFSASSMEASLSQLSTAKLTFERLEAISDSHSFGRKDTPVVAAYLRFDSPGESGGLMVVLSNAMLLPIRRQLSQDTTAESSGTDPGWAKQMHAGVRSTLIPLKAVLEELELTLGEIAQFEVGKVLDLRGQGMGRVLLDCGGHELFWCKLGQNDGRYTLEIEEPIAQGKSLVDELIGN